jgi:hypothetical protein
MSGTIYLPSVLMIGGSGRNVGKTTLICAIIRKFACNSQIIGLKVTSIRAGEESSHGFHETLQSSNFKIIEETGKDSGKDTSKMLQAGAKKVYFIQSTDEQLPIALNSFFEQVDRNSIIICETRNLRRLVKPGIFILITDAAHDNFKANSPEFLDMADLHLKFDIANHTIETNVEKICLENGKWRLVEKINPCRVEPTGI